MGSDWKDADLEKPSQACDVKVILKSDGTFHAFFDGEQFFLPGISIPLEVKLWKKVEV